MAVTSEELKRYREQYDRPAVTSGPPTFTGSSGSGSTNRAKDYGAQIYKAVSAAKPKQVSTYNPEYKPGQMTDLSQYQQAVGTAPRQVQTPQAQTPQTFQLTGLQNQMNQQQQAGTNPTVAQERFQTPEQLGLTVQEIVRMLQPYTQSQQQAATSGFNQAMQNLQSQWASRGLLASGAAAAQERQGAENLAQQLAAISAQQQANAIPLALQYGQLGLEEAGQRFNQQANIRDFEQARAQQAVQNYLAGLGQQEQMRQFEQGLGLDVERLRSQEQQNYLNQLANYLGMEQSQNQWAQEFGLNRQAQDFARWLSTQQLNQQSQSDWLGKLLAAAGQAQAGQQFNQQMDWDKYQYGNLSAADQANLGMQQQQFDVNAILQAIGMTGQAPAAQALPPNLQWMAGQPTLGARELTAQEKAQAFQNALAEAELLGSYKGQQTLAARQLAQAAAEAAQRIGLDREQLRQQQEQQRLQNLFNVWQAAGQAPAGLPDVVPGTPLYNPSAKSSANEIKADALEGVNEAIRQGISKQDIAANINSQYADLVRQGIDPQWLIDYLNQKELEGAFIK